MRRQGFTLIELCVVVTIGGVLATMGIAKFQEFETRARQEQPNIQPTHLVYFASQGRYEYYRCSFNIANDVAEGQSITFWDEITKKEITLIISSLQKIEVLGVPVGGWKEKGNRR